MDKISVVYSGEAKEARLVRYFSYNDQRYLVISFDEEENGYNKLYVCKVINGIEGIATIGILDETEWDSVKNVIKIIIKEIRENMLVTVTDLDYKEIEGITINQTRAFKLLSSAVEMFESNKKVFEEKTVEQPVLEQTVEQAADLDYKELYLKEIEDKKELQEQLNEANTKLQEYQNKIDGIKQLLN